MIIERLDVYNFRNYREASVGPSSGSNVLWGANAEGKTNLLEAIIVCSTGRSPRAAKDSEMIRWNEQAFHISAAVRRGDSFSKIEVGCDTSGRKVIRINGLEKRAADLLSNLNIVSFLPDDVYTVKGSPLLRRRMIDLALSQGNPGYHYNLLQYHKVLLHRNTLLKQSAGRRIPDRVLEPWDTQLARIALFLMRRRKAALATLSADAAATYTRLSGGETLEVRYRPSIELEDGLEEAAEAAVIERLAAARDEDCRKGATSIGPHRDDIAFTVGGADARSFGSQGQQRTAVLAMKSAEMRFLQARTGERPVLLLDDVFSELDDYRQASVVREMTAGVQSFITCTEAAEAGPVAEESTLFRVKAGEVVSCDAAEKRS